MSSTAHKVLITDRLARQGVDRLRTQPDIAFDFRPGLSEADLTACIGAYHGLIVRSGTRVTPDVIGAAHGLRVIGRAGIGVDNIDVASASQRGIVVMNTPGGNNVTTAEHTVSMLLALARNIPQAAASLKAGEWRRGAFTGTEVCNKVLGVVGLGNIGAIVAERALGLRMRVVGYDPFVPPEAAAKMNVELLDLPALYERADFITVHTPLTKETRGLIDAAAFARMKDEVRVVNCARGGIIDEAALLDALERGKVAGAALDVFVDEPPSADHPLLVRPDVICTPHLGAATDEAQINVAVAIADQIVHFLRDGVIQNAVNFPALSREQLAILQPYLLLGERLGSFLAQITPDAPREIHVEYSGEVTDYDVTPATAAVLRGVLAPVLDQTVNYINAPLIARERGIRVVESRSRTPSDFLNSVSVHLQSGTAANTAAGAVFSNRAVRLVRVNDFHLEAVPEGTMLMLHNRDVPGVVGQVGMLLGTLGINIAGLELGREKIGGEAISLIHVDTPVSPDVLTELHALEPILSAQLIRL